MMYHPDGRYQVAQDESEEKLALKAGWKDKPDVLHLELAQGKGKRLPISEPETAEPPKSWGKEEAKS